MKIKISSINERTLSVRAGGSPAAWKTPHFGGQFASVQTQPQSKSLKLYRQRRVTPASGSLQQMLRMLELGRRERAFGSLRDLTSGAGKGSVLTGLRRRALAFRRSVLAVTAPSIYRR
jgi:hypothetical protein